MFAKTCLAKSDMVKNFLYLISEIYLMYRILKLLPVFSFLNFLQLHHILYTL